MLAHVFIFGLAQIAATVLEYQHSVRLQAALSRYPKVFLCSAVSVSAKAPWTLLNMNSAKREAAQNAALLPDLHP